MAYYLTKPRPTWKIVKSECCCPSISSCFNSNSMSLFFSNVTYQQERKRLHFITTCSIEPSSSSSSSASASCSSYSTSQTNALAHVTNKKFVKNDKSNDGSFSVIQSDQSVAIEKKITKKAETNPKRPFWRRVLFASKKIKSVLLLNVITIVYASDIPVVKAVEEIMDPATFCAVRFVMSAIPFLPFVFQARDDVKTRNAGIELGLWVSLGYFVEALGLFTSDAGRASFISLFTVIVVPLLDGMVGVIIPARTWFGVLMSTLGVGVLECSGSPPNVGDLLNFLSAIFFGIHMLRTERISRSTKKENFLPLLGYEVCVVALLSTIWVLVGGWFDSRQDFDQSSWTWTVLWDWMAAFPWVPALYTGVFSTGICLWIED